MNKQVRITTRQPCGQGAPVAVDLVVVSDASASMIDEALALNAAADTAVSMAAAQCPSNLRVAWFGIEGYGPGTRFTQSYRTYLHRLGVSDGDIVGTPDDREDGAAAVIDLATHYDWRPEAERAIFLLGDEALESGNPQDEADVAAANRAIAVARAAKVKVFTYAGTGAESAVVAEFTRLALETGGQVFVSPVQNLGGFQTVLTEIICANVPRCNSVDVSVLKPCFEIRQSQASVDQFEPNQAELLELVAINPYANLTIKDLHIVITLVSTVNGQPIELLPNGAPAILITPINPHCFGDLPPCNPQTPEQLSSITRQIVLIRAKPATEKYLAKINYHYSIEFTGVDEFEL